MPKSSLADSELELLINSVLSKAGGANAERLLDRCHEYIPPSAQIFGESLAPHERYFRKEIEHDDFDVHVRHFLCDGASVVAADIQFKRASRFPWPLWNRNRRLVAKLRKWAASAYAEPGVEVKDDLGGRQIHFCVSSSSVWWRASTPFEEWESECAIS